MANLSYMVFTFRGSQYRVKFVNGGFDTLTIRTSIYSQWRKIARDRARAIWDSYLNEVNSYDEFKAVS